MIPVPASLKGMGHFTLWYSVGCGVFFTLRERFPRWRRLALYGPFLPFIAGCVSALPYLLQVTGLVSRAVALSPPFMLLLFYPVTETSVPLRLLFGSFHVDVVLSALLYLCLLGHYIGMLRRFNWSRAQ